MTYSLVASLFHIDVLARIMMTLVIFIGICVGSFACRYMQGDTKYRLFLFQLSLLIITICLMVSADNLALLAIAWCLSNMLLVRLMIHKPRWRAAKRSGLISAKNYCLGATCIVLAFILFYELTGQTSIQLLLEDPPQSDLMLLPLVLLLLGAMTQSAIWPFHRWLISSLNSPTPVSAIMHAGLVNGGGFLLIRFAPLYLEYHHLLTTIFVIGIISGLLGTLWKLMQSDVKRMLACSTMGQMGFMLAQCGLGLFPAAAAHLILHGMFKAYLFLGSGSVAQEKPFDFNYPRNLFSLLLALCCGAVGSFGFAFTSHKSWLAGDTTLVLMVVSFLAATQFSLPMLRSHTLKNLPFIILVTGCVGLAYGASVYLIIELMGPMHIMQPQPLNGLHVIGIIALILSWLFIPFIRNGEEAGLKEWRLKGYVNALNSSQPYPNTVTAHRNHYQYL